MRIKRFAIAQVALWTAYAVIRYLAAIPAVPPDARLVMALADGVQACSGLIVTWAMWPLLRHWVNPGSLAGWAAGGLLAAAVSFLWIPFDRALLVSAASAAGLTIPWVLFPHGLDLTYLLVLLAWTGGALGILMLQREAELRERLLAQQASTREAQVHALTAQLNPHFLFNSLNTIRSYTSDDPETAREMLTRLSAFLRHALAQSMATATTLSEEIVSAQAYLWIEQARFEPNLQVRFDIDSSALDALVPPLLLQPLVENAALHGDPAEDGTRHISVAATCREDRLCIVVSNSGTLRNDPHEGIGLALTRARLEQMYGALQRLSLTHKDGWVTITIEVDGVVCTSPGGSP